MAEEVFVIEIDARDDADLRDDNVRGIKPSPESSLENCELHAGFGEVYECDRGHAFEKSGMRSQRAVGEQSFDDVMNSREDIGKGGVRNFFTVYADTLIDSF